MTTNLLESAQVVATDYAVQSREGSGPWRSGLAYPNLTRARSAKVSVENWALPNTTHQIVERTVTHRVVE